MILGDPLATLNRLEVGAAVERQTTCNVGCTSQWSHPINVFADFLHMHSFGRRILTNQYRQGQFIRTTNKIDFWDYAVQEGTLVDYQLLPGISCYFPLIPI